MICAYQRFYIQEIKEALHRRYPMLLVDRV